MKHTVLTILLFGVMVLGIVGCGNKKIVTEDSLNEVNNKIIEYFQTNGVKDYENYSFNYVDITNKKVVVGLLDNSKEQQKKFKELIVDSEYIEFVKAEKLMNYDDYKDNDKTFKENCLENLLGGYITSEKITPTEITLNDILDLDMTKIDYSKVKITENGFIYLIVKTSDNLILNEIDNYFNEKYVDYKKAQFDNAYWIYIDNKNNDFNLEEDLSVCNR